MEVTTKEVDDPVKAWVFCGTSKAVKFCFFLDILWFFGYAAHTAIMIYFIVDSNAKQNYQSQSFNIMNNLFHFTPSQALPSNFNTLFDNCIYVALAVSAFITLMIYFPRLISHM